MPSDNFNIKELKGNSGSKVLLMGSENHFFVRKYGQNNRNIERLTELNLNNINVPRVLDIQPDYYDMEYIPNLDIKTYLSKNPTNDLVEFLLTLIHKFKSTEATELIDFTEIYIAKLANCNFDILPFTRAALIEKLPTHLPVSTYHGDLTLENILFNTRTNSFFLIDPLTTEYNSYIFDLAKLRQDVICQWFIRNDNFFLNSKLTVIDNALSRFDYYNNDYLLILMLLRVLPYTNTVIDRDFILNWIAKLWK